MSFPQDFIRKEKEPSKRSLRLVIPNNACPTRITAAAGTSLARAYSSNTVIIFFEKRKNHAM